MTKIQDIDVAFIETLKKHPNFSENISSILYKNAVEEVYPTNFTSTNMARTRVRRLDNKDFIEYIIKNAVIIYSAYQKLHNPNRHTRNTSWYDESSFPNISEIVKEMEIITNPKINAILYYSANPNQLFVLADAVAKTRFNPKWYSGHSSTFAGLEIVDLFSYPIHQYIKYKKENLSFKTIKEKIVGYPNFNNKGIKVFPKEKDR